MSSDSLSLIGLISVVVVVVIFVIVVVAVFTWSFMFLSVLSKGRDDVVVSKQVVASGLLPNFQNDVHSFPKHRCI